MGNKIIADNYCCHCGNQPVEEPVETLKTTTPKFEKTWSYLIDDVILKGLERIVRKEFTKDYDLHEALNRQAAISYKMHEISIDHYAKES